MQGLAGAPAAATLDGAATPRSRDGATDVRELLRQLAEPVASEAMDAEADQMCGEGNGGNGRGERRPSACVGTPAPGVPSPGGGPSSPRTS
jgi:hypothetical protein